MKDTGPSPLAEVSGGGPCPLLFARLPIITPAVMSCLIPIGFLDEVFTISFAMALRLLVKGDDSPLVRKLDH